ncbi:MAG TPA: hypothetical protein VK691_01780 [Solirubrobacteraceae bacterium]|nr:hypothetical protein [Solirubrobacteraceae bacterium]
MAFPAIEVTGKGVLNDGFGRLVNAGGVVLHILIAYIAAVQTIAVPSVGHIPRLV